MKIFVFDKYTVMASFLIVCVIALGAVIGAENYAVNANTTADNTPIYSVETEEKCVSITFDSAWGAEDMDSIISILNKYGCKATFFVTGDFAEKYEGSILRLHEQGHEIASHSYSHAHFNSLAASERLNDIEKADKTIKDITGQEEVLFRAPYGEYDSALVSLVRSTGRYIIQWDIDSLDWKGLTAKEMEDRIIPKLQNGSIILFHSGTENTYQALPQILEKIISKGYAFKKTGDLIYKGDFTVDVTGRQQKISG